MAVYLAYPGMQDMFLTDQPEFTHFKTVYSRDIKSETRIVEHPFDQTNYSPGNTLIATLKQNGDYLTGVSLKVNLPKITPQSNDWVYPNYLNFLGKKASVFYSNGVSLYTLTFNGLLVTTKNTYWFTPSTTSLSLPYYISVSNSSFVFNTNGATGCYAVFEDSQTAKLFGFIYNTTQLFGGYVRTNLTNNATFQETGWVSGDTIYGPSYSYLDDTLYNVINSVSLYIGKQLVQEFDSYILKFLEYTDTSYKNRPILKLLEGNDSIVDFNRVYYMTLPFIKIPMYAIRRQDVQIRVRLNPLDSYNSYMSLVLSYDSFSTESIPKNYMIHVPQYSYFSNTSTIDVRGPITKFVIKDSRLFKCFLNGEEFSNETFSKPYVFENLKNTTTSNIIVFNNPINMSRIKNQIMERSSDVYSNTLNILKVSNDLSGLMFDSTESRGKYPTVYGKITNPIVNTQTYLFEKIPLTNASLICCYSMRVVNPVYNGPVVKLRNETTDEEADFYTDSTQSYLSTSDGISVSDFGTTLRVSVWYDQSVYAKHITQKISQVQPHLLKVLNSNNEPKYVVAILNDTFNSDDVNPSYWLDLPASVHPQQFFVTMKLLSTYGSYTSDYSTSIFSKPYGTFRIQNGGGLYPFGYGTPPYDWGYWPGSNGNTFYVDGYAANYLFPDNNWHTLIGVHDYLYEGSDVCVIGTDSPGNNFNLIRRSMKGYLFELGFANGTTMKQEYDDYYANRPPVF